MVDIFPSGERLPDLDTVSSGRFVVLQYGRNHYELDQNGKAGPEVEKYHRELVWSTNGDRMVEAYYGQGGRQLDFAVVSIRGFNHSDKPTYFMNDHSHPLFRSGFSIAHGMSHSKLFVLSHSLNWNLSLEPISGLVLLSRNLRNLNGSGTRRNMVVPIPSELERASFSPDGKHLAVQVKSNTEPSTSVICIARTDGGGFHPVVKFISYPGEEKSSLKWQPDSKTLSFLHDDWVYVMPVK